MYFKLISCIFLPLLLAQVCVPTKYLDINQKCSPGNTTGETCKTFLKCIDGTCQRSHVGSNCRSNSDCSYQNQGVQCIEGICTKQRYNGYDCTVDAHCYSGKCVNKKCHGLPIGSTCDPTKYVQCAKGLYCSLKKKECLAQHHPGQYCDDVDMNFIDRGSNYNVICPAGTKCTQSGSATNMTCEQVYVKKEGETCLFSEQCHPPYICDTRSATPRCVMQTTTHACPSRQNPSQYCFFYEKCECEKCYQQFEWNKCDYLGTFDRWNKCWRDFNCPYDHGLTLDDWYVDAFDSNTCLGKNCRHIVQDFMCCAMSYQNEYASANQEPLGCNRGVNPLWWLMLFFLITIPCAIGLSGLIFLYMKLKRTQYQEIQ